MTYENNTSNSIRMTDGNRDTEGDERTAEQSADTGRKQSAAQQRSRYVREFDPAKRRQILDTLTREEDPLISLRRQLFESRFGNAPAKNGQYIDGYMRVLLELLQAAGGKTGLFGIGKKQVLQMIKPFAAGKETAKAYGRDGEAALRDEWENAIHRYFDTCLRSGYRKKLFGIVELNEKERAEQIRKDAWSMSFGIAAKYGMEHEMSFFCGVMEDAYQAFAPDDVPLCEGI